MTSLQLYWPRRWVDLLDSMVTVGAVEGTVQIGVMAFGFGFWFISEPAS